MHSKKQILSKRKYLIAKSMSEREKSNALPTVTKQTGSIKRDVTDVLSVENCLNITSTQDIKL